MKKSKNTPPILIVTPLLLNEMISEMLDLERLKSGQIQLKHTMIDLNSLLSQVVNSIAALTPHHSFHLQLDETLPSLSADQDRLIQVIHQSCWERHQILSGRW